MQVDNLKRLREIEVQAGGVEVDTAKYVPTMPWAKQMLSLHSSKDYYQAAVSASPVPQRPLARAPPRPCAPCPRALASPRPRAPTPPRPSTPAPPRPRAPAPQHPRTSKP
jgi:hypothetical protein